MNRLLLIFLFAFFSIAASSGQSPATPIGLTATGFERHVELRWQLNTASNILGYKIFRRVGDSGDFELLKQVDIFNVFKILYILSPNIFTKTKSKDTK